MTAPIKQWIWPVQGTVINKFESKGIGNRGLDIAGRRGEPVRAAASGRVVYSGEGLRGYGRLIIIKHNDDFLSAYAHNDKIFVKENELVKAGQKIASMGSSGAERTKLHFEIRLRGKPVDPLNYLPPI
jgi:lipoprotein NlpD